MCGGKGGLDKSASEVNYVPSQRLATLGGFLTTCIQTKVQFTYNVWTCMNNKHIHKVCIVMVMHACELRGQK